MTTEADLDKCMDDDHVWKKIKDNDNRGPHEYWECIHCGYEALTSDLDKEGHVKDARSD